MTATILDGKQAAAAVRADLADRVRQLASLGSTPGLGTILVGDDPGSHAYVAGKHRDCEQIGITSIRRELPASATQADVERAVDELNADPACTGYIVQLLRAHGVPLAGAKVCVIGRGVTVGRPIGLLLTRRTENATVALCHTGTKELAAEIGAADVVVAAAGSGWLVTPDLVKPGAAVLDVGITRTEDGLLGDVHPDVAEVAGWLAPMPGGVGPMTRAMLLTNVVESAERAA